MAYNGSGTFTRLYSWVTDRTNAIKIRADRMDAEIDGMAAGLSNAICKDGQTTLTGDIPFSNRKLTGLGNATLAADAVNLQTGDGRYQKRVTLLTATAAFDDNDILGLYDGATLADLQLSGANFRTDLLARLRANGDIFATGNIVGGIFRQTLAPTGWTKVTTINDRALRVVSGSLVDGGSTGFSVAFPSQTPAGTVSVAASSLSTAQLAAHTHQINGASDSAGATTITIAAGGGTGLSNTSGSTGSGSTHTHSGTFAGSALASFAPLYADVIFATKN